jgi:hypothetical protein
MNDTASILLAVAALVVAMAVIGLVAGLILHLRHRATRDAARDASDEAREALSLERQQARDAQLIELIPKFAEMISPSKSAPSTTGEHAEVAARDKHESAVDTLADHLRRRATTAWGAEIDEDVARAAAGKISGDELLRRASAGTVSIPVTPAEPATRWRRRANLPLSSGIRILPKTSAQITAHPQCQTFKPLGLVILGNPDKWVVNDIKIGNRSQLSQAGDLPGDLFAAENVGAFVAMETCHVAMNITILVTYIGSDEAGEKFSAAIVGVAEDMIAIDSESADPASDTILPMSSDDLIPPNQSAQITSRPQSAFRPERILIGGNPEDWVVHDIRVGCRSQFLQCGEVGGGLFAAAVDAGLRMDVVQPLMDFVMVVEYVGDAKEGAKFACSVTGTAVGFDGVPYAGRSSTPIRFEIVPGGAPARN